MSLEEAERQYNEYLKGHIGNVSEALELLNTLDIQFVKDNYDELKDICSKHDASKYEDVEYVPYREHFYPINDEEKLKSEAFEQACRHHIKNNKHHWDYWVNDNNELEIPDEQEYKLHCVERCCDWLAMANQHDEVSNEWYYANKDAMIMPDYGFELCDEIMSKVPEKCNLSFTGVRGELDESHKEILSEESIKDLKNKIISLRSKEYLDGILKKSKGRAGYYALKKIIANIEKEDKEAELQKEINKANKEQAQKDKWKRLPSVEIIKLGIADEERKMNSLNDSFNIIRGGKGYLVEASMGQLKRTTLSEDPTRAKKSKHVQSKYIGISKYGVLNFETTSETHSNVKWYQEVHFPSFNGFMNIVEQGDSIEPDDVKKVMSQDNIKISCFTEDTEVQTLDGMKKIKDIKVGDKVLTHTGKYQDVLQTFENDYSGDMIEINGVKSTPNHPYLVKLPNGDIEWKMACEITKDMKLLEVEE